MSQLYFCDFAFSEKEKEKIYFSAAWFNGLVEANTKTGNANIIAKFVGERNIVGMLHSEILYLNNKLYFCPRNTNYFSMYDLEKKEMKTWNIPDNEKYWLEKDGKFYKIIPKGNFIYLLPYNYNQILCFDVENEIFIVYESWFNEFVQKFSYKYKEKNHDWIFWEYLIDENLFISKIIGFDYFMVFHTETGKVSFIEWIGKKIVSVEQSDKKPSLIDEDGGCWEYNIDREKFEKKCDLKISVKNISQRFIREKDIFYLLSNIKNEMILYNVRNNNIKQISFHTKEKLHSNCLGTVWAFINFFLKRVENKLFILSKTNELIEFDMDLESYSSIKFRLDSELPRLDCKLEQFNLKNYYEKWRYFPYVFCDIGTYINIIKDFDREKKENSVGNYGKCIFNILKNGEKIKKN